MSMHEPCSFFEGGVNISNKLKLYILKLLTRIAAFGFLAALYLKDKTEMTDFLTMDIFKSITPLHIIWAMFMVIMVSHLFPNKLRSMALLKSKERSYIPVENYSEFDLLKYVQKQNQTAWTVMLVWLIMNGIWALVYLLGIIGEAELFLLTGFYFLCDYICILFFCPFRSKIMKNKCCVNCRIYDWGHFMMFTPMLFIKNFFSWSLFFTSVIVLIRWEILYAKHPERFWEGSNKILQCANCRDKTCKFKH
ncbi:MAG: hypothetical protein KBA55_01250 [Ruminococcus sp.]|nr:hypothetical protein [Ruminococcus sp.]